MTEKGLLIPHIRVQNANALSSPFTIGFPAMTAWLGAVHALQRRLQAQGITINFDGVGVVSHHFNLQTYKGPDDFDFSIIGTSNPLDKNGERPSFIEEARCHLEVSLVIQYYGIQKIDEQDVIEKISHSLLSQIKIAGGDILGFDPPLFFREFDQIKSKLMPGYALIERRELLIEAMEQGQDAIDALLDYLTIHHDCEQLDQNGEPVVSWHSSRKPTSHDGERGWIVPIATGFQGISELKQAQNQRDPQVPHRFAETMVTLGEFKMAYKIKNFDELIWHYHYDAANHLYLCQQRRTDSQALFKKDGF